MLHYKYSLVCYLSLMLGLWAGQASATAHPDITASTQNAVGEAAIDLSGATISSLSDSVSYRLSLATMSQSAPTSLTYIGGNIGSTDSSHVHSLIVEGCDGCGSMANPITVTIKAIFLYNSTIQFASAFPAGSSITLEGLTGAGTGYYSSIPYFIYLNSTRFVGSTFDIAGSVFEQVYNGSVSTPFVYLDGDVVSFSSSTFNVSGSSFSVTYMYDDRNTNTEAISVVATSLELLAGSSFIVAHSTFDYVAFSPTAVSFQLTTMTVSAASAVVIRSNNFTYTTEFRGVTVKNLPGTSSSDTMILDVLGNSLFDISNNLAHQAFRPYPNQFLFPSFYLFSISSSDMITTFDSSKFRMDSNVIEGVTITYINNFGEAFLYYMETSLQLLGGSSLSVTNNTSPYLIGYYSGILVMAGHSAFAVTGNTIDTRWNYSVSGQLSPSSINGYQLIYTDASSVLRAGSVVNVSYNTIYDSGRVYQVEYLSVYLKASGGNISYSTLEFNGNHMIISEVDRYLNYAYYGSSDTQQFLSVQIEMFLDGSVVTMDGNKALCAAGDKCGYDQFSWGVMFSLLSWEMHSGSTVSVSRNVAELAATGVKVSLGSLRGSSVAKLEGNTVTGMAGFFYDLAGVIVTSHATLALLEGSSVSIASNQISFWRNDPNISDDFSNYGDYFGDNDESYAFYGVKVSGNDIVLSQASSLTIATNTISLANAASSAQYGIVVNGLASDSNGPSIPTSARKEKAPLIKGFSSQAALEADLYSSMPVLRVRTEIEMVAAMTTAPTIAVGGHSTIRVTSNTISLHAQPDTYQNAGTLDGIRFSGRAIAADHSSVSVTTNTIRLATPPLDMLPAPPTFITSTIHGVAFMSMDGSDGGGDCCGIPVGRGMQTADCCGGGLTGRMMQVASTYYNDSLTPTSSLLYDAVVAIQDILIAVDQSTIEVRGNGISINGSSTYGVTATASAWAINSSSVKVTGNAVRMEEYQGTVEHLEGATIGGPDGGAYVHYAFRDSSVSIAGNTVTAVLRPAAIDYFSEVCTSNCGSSYYDYCMDCKPPSLGTFVGYRIEAGRLLSGDQSSISVTSNTFDAQLDAHAFVMSDTSDSELLVVRANGDQQLDDYSDSEVDLCAAYDADWGNWYYYDCDGKCEAYNSAGDYFFYYNCDGYPGDEICYNPTEYYYYDCYMAFCSSHNPASVSVYNYNGYYYYHDCSTPGYGGMCYNKTANIHYDCDNYPDLCYDSGYYYYYDGKEKDGTQSCTGTNYEHGYYYYYNCDYCSMWDPQFEFYYWYDCGNGVSACSNLYYYYDGVNPWPSTYHYYFDCNEMNGGNCSGVATLPVGTYYYYYDCGCTSHSYSSFYDFYYYSNCPANVPQALDYDYFPAERAMEAASGYGNCTGYNSEYEYDYYYDCDTPGFGGDCFEYILDPTYSVITDTIYYDCPRCYDMNNFYEYHYYHLCSEDGRGGECYSSNFEYYYDCPRCESYNSQHQYFYYHDCSEDGRGGHCYDNNFYYYYDCPIRTTMMMFLDPLSTYEWNSMVIADSNISITGNDVSIKPIFSAGFPESDVGTLADFTHPYYAGILNPPATMPAGFYAILMVMGVLFQDSELPCSVGASDLMSEDSSAVRIDSNTFRYIGGYGSTVNYASIDYVTATSNAVVSISSNVANVLKVTETGSNVRTRFGTPALILGLSELGGASTFTVSNNELTFVADPYALLYPYAIGANMAGASSVFMNSNTVTAKALGQIFSVSLSIKGTSTNSNIVSVTDNTLDLTLTLTDAVDTALIGIPLTILSVDTVARIHLTLAVDRNIFTFSFITGGAGELTNNDHRRIAAGIMVVFTASLPPSPGSGVRIRNNQVTSTYDANYDGSLPVAVTGIVSAITPLATIDRQYGATLEITNNVLHLLPPEGKRLDPCTFYDAMTGNGIKILLTQPLANSTMTITDNTVHGIFFQGGVVVTAEVASASEDSDVIDNRKDLNNKVTIARNTIRAFMCSPRDYGQYDLPSSHGFAAGGIVYGSVDSSYAEGYSFSNIESNVAITGNSIYTTLMPSMLMQEIPVDILSKKQFSPQSFFMAEYIPQGVRVNVYDLQASKVTVNDNTIALAPLPDQVQVTALGIVANVDSIDGSSVTVSSNTIIIDTSSATALTALLPDSAFVRLDTPISSGISLSSAELDFSYNKFHTDLKVDLSDPSILVTSPAVPTVELSMAFSIRSAAAASGHSQSVCNSDDGTYIANYTDSTVNNFAFDFTDSCNTTTTSTTTTTTTTTTTATTAEPATNSTTTEATTSTTEPATSTAEMTTNASTTTSEMTTAGSSEAPTSTVSGSTSTSTQTPSTSPSVLAPTTNSANLGTNATEVTGLPGTATTTTTTTTSTANTTTTTTTEPATREAVTSTTTPTTGASSTKTAATSRSLSRTVHGCLHHLALCNIVHLYGFAATFATSMSTCDESLNRLIPTFSAVSAELAFNNNSLFVSWISSVAPEPTARLYNFTEKLDVYRLLTITTSYQLSKNEVSVEAVALSNATIVMGIRAFRNFTTVIDVAIKVLSLQFDEVIEKEMVMVSGINVTYTEVCEWPSNRSSYSRVIAIERPLVYLPRKVFVRDLVNQNIASANVALSFSVGAIAVPTAALQQGVALSLVRMAQCDGDSLDGSLLDPAVHPLRFGLGDGNTKYARGAVLGNLLILPCVWAVLFYFVAGHAVSAWRKQSLTSSREFVGWPGIAITPFSIFSEGSAMACVALLFNASNNALDAVIGGVGLALLLASMVAWARSLWLLSKLKSRSLECRLVLPSHGILRLLKPRYVWELASRSKVHVDVDILLPSLVAKQEANESDAIAASYLDGRLAFVGDSWWMWSQVAASILSVTIGVAEGLSLSDKSQCKTRWAFASAVAILQGMVVLTNTILAEVALLGIICLITFGLIIAISLSTFGVTEFSGGTFDALNALGIANSIVGVTLMVLGVGVSVLEGKEKVNKKAVATSFHGTTVASFWGAFQTDAFLTDQELTQMPTLLFESDSENSWLEESSTIPPTVEHESSNNSVVSLEF